jgi:hypothetical protein
MQSFLMKRGFWMKGGFLDGRLWCFLDVGGFLAEGKLLKRNEMLKGGLLKGKELLKGNC